jgi:hypothetical protein
VDETRERAYDTYPPVEKPMPRQTRDDDIPPPPFQDVPLVSQALPEEHAFVNAYNAVGRPRVVVWVNHLAMPEGIGSSADEIDYEAVENTLADWLSAGGQVAIISPTVGRQFLKDEQAQSLRAGTAAGHDVAHQIDADILVQVYAQRTYESRDGTRVRMVAEAIDLRHGGASLARSVVDVPPPLDRPQINKYTRFMARVLMDRMTRTWETFGAPPPQQGQTALPPAREPGAGTSQPPPADSRPPIYPSTQSAPGGANDDGTGTGRK